MVTASRQRGVALLTVLLVTALMTVLVLAMTWSRQLEMHRTANLIENDQALLLAVGLEEWAATVLRRDRAGNQRDHFGELWAQGLPPTAVEQGMVSGRISDLQGRLNLNNLEFNQATATDPTRNRLERLFDSCGAPPSSVAAVADWLDKDGEMRPNGAEDRDYLIRQPPYRAGNRPLVNPSELLLVAGISPEQYDCLAESVTALPVPTALNVNTASAPALAALAPRLTPAAGEQLVKERPTDGYGQVADFLAQPPLAGSGLNGDGLDLASSYFLVEGRAQYGGAEVRLYSVLQRGESGKITVLGRSIGTY